MAGVIKVEMFFTYFGTPLRLSTRVNTFTLTLFSKSFTTSAPNLLFISDTKSFCSVLFSVPCSLKTKLLSCLLNKFDFEISSKVS